MSISSKALNTVGFVVSSTVAIAGMACYEVLRSIEARQCGAAALFNHFLQPSFCSGGIPQAQCCVLLSAGRVALLTTAGLAAVAAIAIATNAILSKETKAC